MQVEIVPLTLYWKKMPQIKLFIHYIFFFWKKNQAEKPPKRKQRRLNDDNDENAVEIPIERNTKQRIATFSQSNTLKRLNKKQLQVIIDDDDIDTILEAVIYFDDERSFLFRRSNGEYGVIPIKVANIKYPDAVMEFYEKSLMKKL